ncbi:MAG: hypothetical protein V1663_00335 [archaeon]
MLSNNHIKALRILVKRLSNKKINWALIGSTNLAIQGINIKAHDIDILTDKEGAFKINKALKDSEIEAVRYKKSEKFCSYYGLFKINSIKIEVMGDIKNKIPKGDLWSETSRLSDKLLINFNNIKLPVISLKGEYYAYSKMGRKDKAEKIKERLKFKMSKFIKPLFFII